MTPTNQFNPSAKSILIVEDEEDLRDMLSEELKSAGFNVLSSSTISGAMKYLSNQSFACILLDILFETGSGTQIISTIRANSQHLNYRTPVLVVSGGVDLELVRQIKGAVHGVFVKPFKLPALVQKIRSLCEENK